MKVALGQFAVDRDWQNNAQTCVDLMQRAAEQHAHLLVLPEAVLARDNSDPGWGLHCAQPLDGPFVTQLLRASQGTTLTTVFTFLTPGSQHKALNALIAIRNGEIVARYDKLHLYDAFAMQESQRVIAGNEIPPLLEIDGMKVGLMTCYDVRFPDLARRLACDGAEVLVLPAAWVRGPLKEHHWELLTTARALENTCYMVAVGECGPRNCANSLVIDPLGVAMVKAGESPALLFAELAPERVRQAREALPVLENNRFVAPQLKA